MTWRRSSRAGFDPGYRITIGGSVYTALSDIQVSRSIGDGGYKGVATTALSFRVYSSSAPDTDQGTAVTFSGVGVGQTFYVDNVQRDGNVYSYNCYDACKNLDREFDASDYGQYEGEGTKRPSQVIDGVNWWNVGIILGDIATRCGFSSGAAPSGARVAKLCYNDINGKSCRQILDDLSTADTGYYYCSTGNVLSFYTMNRSQSTTIGTAEHSEIKVTGTRHIGGVYAKDGIYGTETVTGTDTIDISGRYMDATVTAAAAITVGNWYYTGFEIENLVVSSVSPLGTVLTDTGAAGVCVELEQVYRFGRAIIARIAAPRMEIDPYIEATRRRLKEQLMRDSINGAVQITAEDGLVAVPTTTGV